MGDVLRRDDAAGSRDSRSAQQSAQQGRAGKAGAAGSYSSLLPTAVIVAGLAALSILAVLTAGPEVQSESPGTNQQASVDLAPAAVETAVETKAKSKPEQLAAAVSPVIFETGPEEPQKVPESGQESGQESGPKTDKPSGASTPLVNEPAGSPNAAKLSSVIEQPPQPVQSDKLARAAVDPEPTTPQPMPRVTESTVARVPADKAQAPSVKLPEAISTETQPKTELVEKKVAEVEQKSEQIKILEGENERLKEMMVALENETLNLNSELLKLELSLAEASEMAQPRQVVETKTIYNFVNVPLGGDIDGNGAAPTDDSYIPPPLDNPPSLAAPPVDNSYVDNSLGSDPYRNQNQLDPMTVADMPAPEMGFSPDGQFAPPPHELYRENPPADPYFDQNSYFQQPGQVMGSDEQLYGNGADLQHGIAPQPVDLRGYPPVN